jgi:RNA polymerase sigma-70 factor (ECF subfamily)
VNDREAAEELMQEAYFRAWQSSVRKKEEITDLKKFLYKIANNLVIDHYRSRHQAALPLDQVNEAAFAYQPQFGEENDRAAEIGIIDRILPRLKENYHRVLSFHYKQGLSVAEISRLTNLSPNNINVIKHRSVKKMRQLLCAEEPQYCRP